MIWHRFHTTITRSLQALFCLLSIVNYAYADPDLEPCASIIHDTARLECYDHLLEARLKPASAEPSDQLAEAYMDQTWELSPKSKRETFAFSAYRPNYLLPMRYTSRTNTSPQTPTHVNLTNTPLQPYEVRFQLSFKTKLKAHLFGSHANAWFAYTQQSNWQFYNSSQSAPFRETNYEPEFILSIPTGVSLAGFDLPLINVGMVHQSNGNAGVYSRSWNRIYSEFKFTQGNFLMAIRPWVRLPEAANNNDNPDIRRFMGSGDLRLTWLGEESDISALTRYSVRGRKGAIQINASFPINGHLKGYAELFNGYGETLIDYNHYQSIIAVGVLLSTWH